MLQKLDLQEFSPYVFWLRMWLTTLNLVALYFVFTSPCGLFSLKRDFLYPVQQVTLPNLPCPELAEKSQVTKQPVATVEQSSSQPPDTSEMSSFPKVPETSVEMAPPPTVSPTAAAPPMEPTTFAAVASSGRGWWRSFPGLFPRCGAVPRGRDFCCPNFWWHLREEFVPLALSEISLIFFVYKKKPETWGENDMIPKISRLYRNSILITIAFSHPSKSHPYFLASFKFGLKPTFNSPPTISRWGSRQQELGTHTRSGIGSDMKGAFDWITGLTKFFNQYPECLFVKLWNLGS